MWVRGIRGATTVEKDESAQVLKATMELFDAIVKENNVLPEDICSIIATVTQDITSAFPARAIRQMEGWELVPMMCANEIPVPGSLPLCIRLMVQVNTEKKQKEIVHIYHNHAKVLRPDLTDLPSMG